MLEAYLSAALITAGIIIGLGPQNLFIIRQGLRGEHVWLTVLVCELCEIVTILLGAFGIGYLFSQYEILQKLIGIAGVLFLLYYGYKSFRAAFQSHEDIDLEQKRISAKQVILTSLSISLLNPWALTDTMVIVGGGAAQYESLYLMTAFILGSLTVSILWFSGIGFGARKFSHLLNTPKANKILDLVAGFIMWIAALNLARIMIFS